MSQVQVILQEDVHGLGHAGDVVQVKPGYARNFLLPQGKALQATAERVNELEHQKRVVNDRLAKTMSDVEAVRRKLDGVKLEVTAQIGEEGKLFGSVTTANIADLLKEKGFDVDRRMIVQTEPIKTAGEHAIAIKLHRDVEVSVKLTVLASE